MAYKAGYILKRVVVVDGIVSQPYVDVMKGYPIFSPNSQHVVYVAQTGDKKWVVVVDGMASQPYDAVSSDPIVFSADGNSMTYVILRGTEKVKVEVKLGSMGVSKNS